MKIGPATGSGQNLRITSLEGNRLLTVEMTWDEWDELTEGAEYFRSTGQVYPGNEGVRWPQ